MEDRPNTGRLVQPSELTDEPLFEQRIRFYIPVTKPIFTRLLVIINVAVFILTVLYGVWQFGSRDFMGNDLRSLIIFGAKVNQLIAVGQVWRLFTATFLHADILHLLFNMYALGSLGYQIESYFGRGRFLTIYVLAGLWGSLASYATSTEISVGASGAIFGLAGATAVYFLRYRENFGEAGRATLRSMLVLIGFNLFFGFTNPQIDNAGHIGGLIGGALVALGMLPIYRKPTTIQIGNQPLEKTHRLDLEILWTVANLALLWVGVSFVTRSLLAG